MLLIRVANVFGVTSSMTSSSSPVDLFWTSHSKTSSSRDNSPVGGWCKIIFFFFKFFEFKISFKAVREQSFFCFWGWMRMNVRFRKYYVCVCVYIWLVSRADYMAHLRIWSVSDVDSKPMLANCQDYTLRLMLHRVSLQNRCPIDQLHRQYFPIPAMPWHTYDTAAYLSIATRIFRLQFR